MHEIDVKVKLMPPPCQMPPPPSPLPLKQQRGDIVDATSICVTPPLRLAVEGLGVVALARDGGGGILLLLLLLASCVSTSYAQRHFGVQSYGIHAGSYNPSFDHWDDTTWDFGPATMVGIDMNLDMARRVRLRVGAAYGTTTSTRQRFAADGTEELRYRFLPIGSTLIVHTGVDRFEVYGGAGLELMNIKTTYEVADANSEISGSAFLPHVLVGINIPVVGRLSLTAQAKQVLGTYRQQFQLFGDNNVRIVQPVEMHGLHWSGGIRLHL